MQEDEQREKGEGKREKAKWKKGNGKLLRMKTGADQMCIEQPRVKSSCAGCVYIWYSIVRQ